MSDRLWQICVALTAWRILHKKPIVGKRFVEVFGLFPPHCPLRRRDAGKQSPSEYIFEMAESGVVRKSGLCPFCGFPLTSHADFGIAAMASARMRQLLRISASKIPTRFEGLMDIAFLSVPALLYQDAGAVSRTEVDLFDPEATLRRGGLGVFDSVISLSQLEMYVGATKSLSETVFFNLMEISGYDMRELLSEVVDTLLNRRRFTHNVLQSRSSVLSIAEIGSALSIRARAYLFITELKLRNFLEYYPDIFVVVAPTDSEHFFSVSLRTLSVSNCSSSIALMDPFQLARRRRSNRDSPTENGKRGTQIKRSRSKKDTPRFRNPVIELQRAVSCLNSDKHSYFKNENKVDCLDPDKPTDNELEVSRLQDQMLVSTTPWNNQGRDKRQNMEGKSFVLRETSSADLSLHTRSTTCPSAIAFNEMLNWGAKSPDLKSPNRGTPYVTDHFFDSSALNLQDHREGLGTFANDIWADSHGEDQLLVDILQSLSLNR